MKGWRNESVRHSLARKGIKTKVDNIKIKDIPLYLKTKLTEQEVRLLLRRLNSGKISIKDINKNKNFYEGLGYDLTDNQVKKAYKWLYNLAYTPKGKEKVNSPFGYREQYVLDNFKTVKLIDFYPERYGNKIYYYPVYKVVSKDNKGFDYYVKGGKIHIIG